MNQETSSENSQGLKVFIGITLIVAVVVGTMYYISRNTNPIPLQSVPISSISPDTVRAIVNGEEILQVTIDELIREAGQALSAQDVNISDQNIRVQIEAQIIDDTINFLLLKQEATKTGITADPAAIDETYQTFVTQAGGEIQLVTQLQQAGLTEESFRQRLAEQILVESFLNENVDTSNITITEVEVTTAYNLAVANSGGGTVPLLSEVRSQVEQQIRDQKRQELVDAFMATLLERATIEIK